MPYQGGQRGAKNAPKAKGINWTPQFPGAGFLFGPGAFYAGRGANASQMAPTDAQLRAEGYGDLVNDAARLKSIRTGKPAGSAVVTPVMTPAGVVQPGAIVSGLTPGGTVDRTQGDEYKSQMAQYQNLIKQQQQAEAEDLGMKIFMEKYAKSPIAQAGGAIGAYNPLLAASFPDTKGFAGTFAPVEEIQMGDLGTRAQGEMGPTMESLNPLASQAAQQEATATQANMATTAGLSTGDRARNLTRAFRLGLI